MKPLTIELCSLSKPKIGKILETFEEMETFLLRSLDKERADAIMESFREQAKCPEKIPNVLIFLDDDNQSINIDDFMKKYNA